MCNEIEYAMIQEYLLKIKQKEKKEKQQKELEKPLLIQAVA